MTMNTHRKTLLAALAGTAFLAGSVQAATITGVTIEDVGSELVFPPFPFEFDRMASYTLDGVGYEVGVQNTHSSGLEGVHWLSTGTGFGINGITPQPLPTFIVYDLEGNYDLDSFTVWNYNEAFSQSRGANAVTVSVADSVGGTFTPLAGITNFAIAPGNDTTLYGETFDLTSLAAADDVRLVRIDITSNYGAGESVTGLSEIRFGGTLIPEPSSLALLGLGGLFMCQRRRR
ncbi:MAG: PEP-CTERM sorting domain-containing protein [Planctomycetota bacterium]